MPLDLNCPKCQHVFPVTEARHPVGVQCPGCDADLTAEFRKRPTPVPGEHPYELLVTEGRLAGSAAAPAGTRKLKLEDDDEQKPRGGGSMTVVVVAGLGALLVALGGLTATGYFLFTNLDTSDSTIGSANRSGSNATKGGPTPGRAGPNPRPNPGPGPIDPFEQPKKKADTFELKPAAGAPPKITPPDLPAEVSNVPLPGRIGALAVGGGGRYLVMHFPDQAKLGVFDAGTARFHEVAADAGDARLAAGLSRVVLYVPVAKIFRVYALPDLGKEYDATVDLFFGANAIALGSRTNGPLLVEAGFGEVRLYDIGGAFTEIEGAAGKPGIHSSHNGLRASPDGTAFATFDGTHPGQKTTILSTAARKWKVAADVGQVPFPGGDGNFYGNGVVLNKDGRDQKFGGLGAGSNTWFVPAVSGNTHFLKVTPTTVQTPPRGDKKTIAVTVHANKKSDTPVAGAPVFTDLPEFDGFRDIFSTQVNVVLDQHLFLVPEAKLLVVVPHTKDRLVLRKVDLK